MTAVAAAQAVSEIGQISARAKEASRVLSRLDRDQKDQALAAVAAGLRASASPLVAANEQDLARGRENGLPAPMQDRLQLTEERIGALALAVEEIIALDDPVGRVLQGRTLPNGIQLSQVSVPLGVVGAIYEARPNVTVDIAALALKSGNAAILRGGSAALNTNEMLLSVIRQALASVSVPQDAVQSIDAHGREGATELMTTRGSVDVLIPRGGHELIQHVVTNSKVPVIETGEGNVHVYVDASADSALAASIVHNAKTHRTSVCNSAETLLIHAQAESAGRQALAALVDSGVVLYADSRAQKWLPEGTAAQDASPEHYAREFLDMTMAVAVVDSIDEAVSHIRQYSTGHTEAIVTDSVAAADQFIAEVDAAAVMVNASTRFTDGGEFGLGAEVGISTQKMHARGPMGLGELTTTKWIARGQGQIRR